MTVIAAVIDATGAHVASDSMCTDGLTVVLRPKFATVAVGRAGRVIVGSSGRSALLPLCARLSAPFEPDPNDPDDLDGWAQAMAEALTEAAVEARPSILDDDGALDGTALLVHPRRMWSLTENLAIELGPFGAIGAGAQVALGVLDVMQPHPSTETRVRTAVETTIRHNPDCRGPVQYTHLPHPAPAGAPATPGAAGGA